LLQAIPLSAVGDELDALIPFLATTLGISEDEFFQALQTNVPHLAQAIIALRPATRGWNNVPNIDGLTRFNRDARRVGNADTRLLPR
jgi:hypothetical protein